MRRVVHARHPPEGEEFLGWAGSIAVTVIAPATEIACRGDPSGGAGRSVGRDVGLIARRDRIDRGIRCSSYL